MFIDNANQDSLNPTFKATHTRQWEMRSGHYLTFFKDNGKLYVMEQYMELIRPKPTTMPFRGYVELPRSAGEPKRIIPTTLHGAGSLWEPHQFDGHSGVPCYVEDVFTTKRDIRSMRSMLHLVPFELYMPETNNESEKEGNERKRFAPGKILKWAQQEFRIRYNTVRYEFFRYDIMDDHVNDILTTGVQFIVPQNPTDKELTAALKGNCVIPRNARFNSYTYTFAGNSERPYRWYVRYLDQDFGELRSV